MFSRPRIRRSFGFAAIGLWWLVALLYWPLATAAVKDCDATVLLIDTNISDSDYVRATANLKAADPARQLGAVIFDSVVRQVVRPAPGTDVFAQIDTALSSSRSIGGDGRSNFAVAAERSLDLFGLASDRKGRQCLLLLGEDRINSGKPELNKQYRQWFDEVLMPRMTQLGVSFTGIDVAPTLSPPVMAAENISEPTAAAEELSPAAELKDGSPGAPQPADRSMLLLVVGAVLILVAVVAAILVGFKRRAAGGAASPPAEKKADSEVPPPQPTVVRPLNEDAASSSTPEKTQVRPASVPTQTNNNLGDTAKRPAIRTDTTAVTEPELPAAKAPSPDTTQVRPDEPET